MHTWQAEAELPEEGSHCAASPEEAKGPTESITVLFIVQRMEKC